MNSLIDAAFSRGRAIALLFIMMMVMGTSAYVTIPKESEPDVSIPVIYVSVSYDGISPEDAERLLVRPLEKELQSVEGIKELHAAGAEGYASVTLELEAGADVDKALQSVRDKVDIARPELPPGSDEPQVNEVNTSLFPVLTVVLSGPTPERSLLSMARGLKDEIEALSDVLEVKIRGEREEVLEIIADPAALEAYNISFNSLFSFIQQNNRLVAAGALDTGAGRMVFKFPGVLESLEDLASLPVKVDGSTVVTFQDVATLHCTFKDPTSFARIDGHSALALEVSKRSGSNIIETIEQVRSIVDESKAGWPETVSVDYLLDKSEQIKTMLGDLENNVLAAIFLVMIVIVAVLGVRPAILVGMAIPGSFLVGMLVLNFMGITLNILVLFSLILVVGMLVDGAIVTIELADRKLSEGVDPQLAYAEAAKRMAWPITASTATTLAVFVPLLFWPGLVGEFMVYLPITVIVVLIASLAMALIFVPVLGSILQYVFGSKNRMNNKRPIDAAIKAAESGDLDSIGGLVGGYLRLLKSLLKYPAKIFGVSVLGLVFCYWSYSHLGHGVVLFPAAEPEFVQIQVQGRGDMSVFERDHLVRQVENSVLGMPFLKSVYARTIGEGSQVQSNLPIDTIGIIQLQLVNWAQRPPATELIPKLRKQASVVPGVKVQVVKEETGPVPGKPVELEISGFDLEKMSNTVAMLRSTMNEIGGFEDLEDSRPLPSIEWRLIVDREKAAQFGADVSLVGHAITMITNGIKLAEYRPDDADEELEIRIRFPKSERSLDQLNRLRVPTENGAIPISNFVRFEPGQKTGSIDRNQGKRILEVKAGVVQGLLADDQVKKLKQAMEKLTIPEGVKVRFKGQDEQIQETMIFLIKAFITAIFLMWIILVTQFNSIYQSLMVLSAIVFSTAGVLVGLVATGQAFGIVMSGLGVIALAGIVVNNNIVLIDTYNDLKQKGTPGLEAILRTAAQRMRPVLLTSGTTVLGLLPMVFALTIDMIDREISVGAPSANMWIQLASTIAGGLTFATVLTLFLTPCLLMVGVNVSDWRKARKEKNGPVIDQQELVSPEHR